MCTSRSYFTRLCAALAAVLLLAGCSSPESSEGGADKEESEGLEPNSASISPIDSILRMEGPSPFAKTSEPKENVGYVSPQPHLIGGMSALHELVQYPEEARRKEIEGRVFVELLVTETGDVDSVKVLRGVHPLLDKEAVRAVRETEWKPAEKDGEPQRAVMWLPVTFQLDSTSVE